MAAGSLDVIHLPRFWDPQLGGPALQRVRFACESSAYTLTSDLQSLATSIGEVDKTPRLRARYLSAGHQLTADMRSWFFAGLANPLETFRCQIDELWPHGASVARMDGRPMLPGIIRRWTAGGRANPHIDQRSIEVLAALELVRRIGVNIYLSMPPDIDEDPGGEIEFWGRVEDESEYAAVKREDYGLNRDALGPPQHIIRPAQGDLLMFDASQIHGVREVRRPDRITIATFIGHRGPDHPLVFFA